MKAELKKQGKKMSAAEIRKHLQATADDIALRDGNGASVKRLNVGRALGRLGGAEPSENQPSSQPEGTSRR